MLVGDNYYSLQLVTNGATGTAYFYVSLANAAYDGAAVTIYPTGTQATYFNYRDNSFQFQAPAARALSAGGTVVTSASTIEGELGASPAVSSAVTLTLYGASGQLGSVTLQPGQTSVDFHFPAPLSDATTSAQATEWLQRNVQKPAEA